KENDPRSPSRSRISKVAADRFPDASPLSSRRWRPSHVPCAKIRRDTLHMLMSTGLTTQIEIDARGVAWVAGANTKVKEIVLDKLAYGWSPEEMHFQHRPL